MRKKISGTEIYCKYRTRKDIALYGTPIITAWITKTINFKFDEPFSVDYGNSRSEDKSKGVLNYFCKRPQENIINCKSKEKKKGWKIVFDWIFTENSLVNKSLFITKNIGMTKKYRRLAA